MHYFSVSRIFSDTDFNALLALLDSPPASCCPGQAAAHDKAGNELPFARKGLKVIINSHFRGCTPKKLPREAMWSHPKGESARQFELKNN